MRQATRAQWIKCATAILLYLIFLIWVRSWWGLIVVPFIFDIYITKKIPWSFWKKSKNPAVRSIMSCAIDGSATDRKIKLYAGYCENRFQSVGNYRPGSR